MQLSYLKKRVTMPDPRPKAATKMIAVRRILFALCSIAAIHTESAHALFGIGDDPSLKVCKDAVEARNAAPVGIGPDSILFKSFHVPGFGLGGEKAFNELVTKHPELAHWTINWAMDTEDVPVSKFDKDLATTMRSLPSLSQMTNGYPGIWSARLNGKEISKGKFLCAPMVKPGRPMTPFIFEDHPDTRELTFEFLRGVAAGKDVSTNTSRDLKIRYLNVESTLRSNR